MAAQGEAEQLVRSHRNSYRLFKAMMKWGAILALVTTLLIILIIRN